MSSRTILKPRDSRPSPQSAARKAPSTAWWSRRAEGASGASNGKRGEGGNVAMKNHENGGFMVVEG